jgi:putative Holliday junction resolvase
MRLLGIDSGERRVGVAICDPLGIVATPLIVVETGRGGRRAVLAAIAEIARRESAEQLVVGLPLSLNESEGPQAARARSFGTALATATGLPVVFWDERFSSTQADRLLREAGVSRRRRAARQDAAAAAIILQDYLDSHRPRPDGERVQG